MKLSEEIKEIIESDLIVDDPHLNDWMKRIEELEMKAEFNKPKDTSKAIRSHWVMEYAKEAMRRTHELNNIKPAQCFNIAEEMVKEAEKRGLI